MGSSSAIGEQRHSAADDTGSEPRHRAAHEEDSKVRQAVAPRDFIDAARRVRNPLYRSTLDGVDNWPDDSLTMPGIGKPMTVVDPHAPLPADVVPAPPYAFESAYPDGASSLSPGAPEVALEEPAAGAAQFAAESTELTESAEDRGDGPPAQAAAEPTGRLVTLQRRIVAFWGTTRGKWIVAAAAAALALIALCAVLGLRSNVATTEVTPTSNDAPATSPSGPVPSYSPAAPDPYAATTDPAQVAPTPWQPSDSQAATLPPPGGGAASDPMPAMPPGAPMPMPMPAGSPSDDPLSANDPSLDSDPDLDATQPGGVNQMQPGAPQDQTGLAPKQRATPERKAGPLGSLDSLTGPRNSDPGAADNEAPSKPAGGDLAGLGHGL
jgi:hypothetical protein